MFYKVCCAHNCWCLQRLQLLQWKNKVCCAHYCSCMQRLRLLSCKRQFSVLTTTCVCGAGGPSLRSCAHFCSCLQHLHTLTWKKNICYATTDHAWGAHGHMMLFFQYVCKYYLYLLTYKNIFSIIFINRVFTRPIKSSSVFFSFVDQYFT